MLGQDVRQLMIFAVFAVLGVCLWTIFYVASYFCKSKVATVITDVLFGLTATFATCYVNVRVNNGQFRLFVFVGAILGAIVGKTCCKNTLDKVCALLYNVFTKLTVAQDGTHFLQQNDIDIVCDGSTADCCAGLHAVDKLDATVGAKTKGARLANVDTKGANGR